MYFRTVWRLLENDPFCFQPRSGDSM
jgi:hypothetical protein